MKVEGYTSREFLVASKMLDRFRPVKHQTGPELRSSLDDIPPSLAYRHLGMDVPLKSESTSCIYEVAAFIFGLFDLCLAEEDAGHDLWWQSQAR